ncbi:MAG: ArsR/SmtB family transcription factor [Flavobacteriales bacterium]
MEEKKAYSDLEQNLAHYTRALGHPARVAVLVELARRGFAVQGEIIQVPSLSQATIMQHLRELKRAGLLKGRIFGAKADYRIDRENLQKFEVLVGDFFRQFEEL